MAITPEPVFRHEVETSEDATSGLTTTIICHGKLVSGSVSQLQSVVKPFIPQGGRIVLDLTDLNYVDSSGLGALVGLKVSALKEGYCKLEFINLSDRVKELLRLTQLTQIFSS